MTDIDPARYSGKTTPTPLPTPDGYDDPYLFEYSTILLLLLSLPLGLFAFGGFGWILWEIQGPKVFSTVFNVTETEDVITVALDVGSVIIPFIVALLVVVVVHELIHGAVMYYYAKDVTYGVNLMMGAFYTAAFGQFQEIEELVPIAIAPLVVITLVGTPLLFIPVPTIALTVYFVLTINATGAVGDVFVIWQLRQLPKGTLMYDADLRHWYVFEPHGSGGAST